MQKYIDAHCHIGRGTTDVSVAMFFCNSVTESDWANILSATASNPRVLPCLGLHPWRVRDVADGWDARLYDALRAHPRAMLGETGLDKLHPDYDLQMDAFRRQMQIASELHRTVHIHCVRAWNDILASMKHKVPAIVLHGFAGSVEIMTKLTRMENVYFPFGRAICDTRRTRLMSVVRDAPLSRILIESDGDMCDSGAVLRDVVNRMAEIKHISSDDLLCHVYNNSIQVTQNG